MESVERIILNNRIATLEHINKVNKMAAFLETMNAQLMAMYWRDKADALKKQLRTERKHNDH